MHEDNNLLIYKSIFISHSGNAEVYQGSLSTIVNYASISIDTIYFLNLNNDICICGDLSYVNDDIYLNYIATSLYRDYLHLYSINDNFYGPALIFNYNYNQIENQEVLFSIKDIYIDEIFHRMSIYNMIR